MRTLMMSVFFTITDRVKKEPKSDDSDGKVAPAEEPEGKEAKEKAKSGASSSEAQ